MSSPAWFAKMKTGSDCKTNNNSRRDYDLHNILNWKTSRIAMPIRVALVPSRNNTKLHLDDAISVSTLSHHPRNQVAAVPLLNDN